MLEVRGGACDARVTPMDRLDHFNMWFSHMLGLAFLMSVIVLGVGTMLYSGIMLASPKHRHL